MLRCALATIFALVLVLWTMPARTVLAPVAKAAELPAGIPSVYLHFPRELPTTQPVQVLVALKVLPTSGLVVVLNEIARLVLPQKSVAVGG